MPARKGQAYKKNSRLAISRFKVESITHASQEYARNELKSHGSISLYVKIFIHTASTIFDNKADAQNRVLNVFDTHDIDIQQSGSHKFGVYWPPYIAAENSRPVRVETSTNKGQQGFTAIFKLEVTPWLIANKKFLTTEGRMPRFYSSVIEILDFQLSLALQMDGDRDMERMKEFVNYYMGERKLINHKIVNEGAATDAIIRAYDAMQGHGHSSDAYGYYAAAGGSIIIYSGSDEKGAPSEPDDDENADVVQIFDNRRDNLVSLIGTDSTSRSWARTTTDLNIDYPHQTMTSLVKEGWNPEDAIMLTAHLYFPSFMYHYAQTVPPSGKDAKILSAYLASMVAHGEKHNPTFRPTEADFRAMFDHFNDRYGEIIATNIER